MSDSGNLKVSIVIPAKNEAEGLRGLLPELLSIVPQAEIIVVNDGSEDETSSICQEYKVKEICHFQSKGNGAAIKAGVRTASGEVVVCMDADGQHRAKDVPVLLGQLFSGYDMVVGARKKTGQASTGRLLANGFYNKFSGWMVGHRVDDLTSGFRAFYRDKFLNFIHLLPNGFSYPTTITMAFFRAGYSVSYVPIDVEKRVGKSHINVFRDGVRFLLIIFKIGTLYSPIKIFFPVSLFFFVNALAYYAYTFAVDGRFTNMGVLLFVTSILVFLMGLISEQVTMLTFK